MSELKTYTYDDMLDGNADVDVEYYPKSEADKVIAELKADYKEACGRLQTANLIKDEQLAATRHSKYKRCLAIARWCRESLRLMRTYEVTDDYWNLEPGQDAEYFCKKGDFYSKWQKRWLELAEKFKEGK